MRVLLAIDGSSFSQEAERAVLAQLRKGVEVRVLHVIEPISSYISAELFPHFVSHAATIEQDRRDQARDLVADAAKRLRKAGFETTDVVVEGDPKTKILDEATRWHADLIVLGSHGLKGLNRFVMGSVSSAVSQHAPCSVEVVRSARAAKKLSRAKQ